MIKINPALCFKPSDLIKYLQQVTKETTTAEEIAAAVTHRLIMEKELGWKNYFIYFEPADVKQAEVLKKIGSTMAYSELEGFLKNYTQQATAMDYAFVNTDVSPADVYPVQHKRFYPDKSVDATDRFIQALGKWKMQYSSTETTLLIHYKGDITQVDLEEAMKWLNKGQFPFREVVILVINDEGPVFIQVLPNSGDDLMGFLKYPREEMLNIS